MGSKKSESPVVYSALEVANICGVVNQTAINWIRSEYLKAFKTPGGQYRIYPEDLVEFMEKRGIKVPSEVIDNCEKKVVVSSHTILIVDDDKAFNDVMAAYIKKHDETALVSQAFDGFEAGLLMVQKMPKCVILDLDLPGIDGLKLCQKLRTTDAFGHPAVIVVTAAQDEETEKKCAELGVHEYFKKPLTLSDLVTAIGKCFKA
ncbi:MAG: response regulator [Treponema sp.]|nr:response regulator [Treponema sp.]